MNMISFSDIVRVLQQYGGRYRWLDVFTHQVLELAQPTGDLRFYPLGDDQFRVQIGDVQLDVKVYQGKGVIRCSLAAAAATPKTSSVPLAALGAVIGAAVRSTGPAGMILGLLIGGLVGNAIDNESEKPNENRIMTLRYHPETGQWLVYHGPYVQWAKEALRPG